MGESADPAIRDGLMTTCENGGRVPNQPAVSWGLIELRKAGNIDYEERGGDIPSGVAHSAGQV